MDPLSARFVCKDEPHSNTIATNPDTLIQSTISQSYIVYMIVFACCFINSKSLNEWKSTIRAPETNKTQIVQSPTQSQVIKCITRSAVVWVRFAATIFWVFAIWVCFVWCTFSLRLRSFFLSFVYCFSSNPNLKKTAVELCASFRKRIRLECIEFPVGVPIFQLEQYYHSTMLIIYAIHASLFVSPAVISDR